METITSKENAAVKEVQKLIKSARYRTQACAFVIEGVRLCCDALQSDAEIQTAFITQEAMDKHPALTERICSAAQKSYLLPQRLFAAVSDTVTPQGVLCVCRMKENALRAGKGRYIGLEDIQDPQNMGTILRTAEAFGIDGVFLSRGCCDIYAPKVLRGSMGAVFRLQTAISEDLPGFVKELRAQGFYTAGAVPDRRAKSITCVSFPPEGKSAVFIGNEANGLTEELKNVCQELLTIPMDGRAESLNASAAASVVMWEMVRGRL